MSTIEFEGEEFQIDADGELPPEFADTIGDFGDAIDSIVTLQQKGDPVKQYKSAHDALSLFINAELDPYDELFTELDLPFNIKTFNRAMQRKATQAAAECFEASENKLDDDGNVLQIAIDEIDAHPYFDVAATYDWLCASGAPLFANKTYEPMGVNREDFVAYYRSMLVDITQQYIRLVREQYAQNADDIAPAMDCLIRLNEDFFPDLGVNLLQGDTGRLFGMDADEYFKIMHHFSARQFQDQWRDVRNYVHTKNNNDDVYASKVIGAYSILMQSEVLVSNKAIFEELGVTFDKVHKEFERCLNMVLYRDVAAMTQQQDDPELDQYFAINDRITLIEKAIGDELEFHDAFTSAGYQNKTEFMRHLITSTASAQLNQALDGGYEDIEQWLLIDDADKKLSQFDSRFNGALVANMGIDTQKLTEIAVDLLPRIIALRWAKMAMPDMYLKLQLEEVKIIQDELKLYQSLAPDQLVETPPIPLTAFSKRYQNLSLRQAEMLMFESQLVLPGSFGSYQPLKEAFDIIDGFETSVLSDKFRKTSGLPVNTATDIQEQYELLQNVMDWRDVHSDKYDEMYRLRTMQDLVEKYDEYVRRANPKAKDHDPYLLADFMHYTDIKSDDDVYGALRQTAYDFIAFARDCEVAKMDDKQTAFEIVEELFNSVHILTPKIKREKSDTAFALRFAKLTGFDYAPMRELYDHLHTWHSAAMSPQQPVFEDVYESGSFIAKARRRTNAGAVAYNLLADLSRRLYVDGVVLMDERVLSAGNTNFEALREMGFRNAIIAAGDCVKRAKSKKDFVLTAKNNDQHPVHDLNEAVTWVMKANRLSPLHDAPYVSMGLKNRNAFLNLIRAANEDYALQLEILAVQGGVNKMGALAYLKTLSAIQRSYITLGRFSDADAIRASRENNAPMGEFSPRLVQFALRKYTHLAISEIVAKASDMMIDNPNKKSAKDPDKIPNPARHSYIYKSMMQLVDLATRALGDPKKLDEWGNKADAKGRLAPFEVMTNAIRNRVAVTLGHYYDRPGDPSRGFHVAAVLKNFADKHAMHGVSWFEDMFTHTDDATFANFCYNRCDAHIRQILIRNDKRVLDENNNANDLTATEAVIILRDLSKIDQMLDSGLITKSDIAQIYEQSLVDADFVREIAQDASLMAVHILAAAVRDPFIDDSERENRIDELEKCVSLVGKPILNETLTPYDELQVIKASLFMHSASAAFFMDMIRANKVPTVNDNTILTHDVMNRMTEGFTDTQTMRNLGLTASEAKHFASLEPYVQAYRCMLASMSNKHNKNQQAELLFSMFAHGENNGFSIADPQHRAVLGINTAEDFYELVDRDVMTIIRAYAATIEREQGNPDVVRQIASLADNFIQATRIEERYDPETFKKNNIPMRQDFIEIGHKTAMRQGRHNSLKRWMYPAKPPAPANI